MDFSQAKKLLEQGIPFVQRSGIEILELKRGFVRLRLPYAPNVNHIGTVYAGALFTGAELPGGALFLSSFDVSRYFPIVRSMNIEFLKPAKADVFVEVSLDEARITAIQAEADAAGKADFELEARLLDAEGTLLARSLGKYQLRRTGA